MILLNNLCYDSLVSLVYENVQKELYSKREKIFAKFDLPPPDSIACLDFKNYIKEEFQFYKNNAIARIKGYYSRQSINKIDSLINLINNDKIDQAIEKSQILIKVDNLIQEHTNIFNQTTSKYFESIKAKSLPLTLIVIFENDTLTQFKDLNIDLILNTKNENYREVDILDNTSNEIKTPENLKYDDINYITVKYLNKDYQFYEKIDASSGMPDWLVAEMNNPAKSEFKLENFEELLHWYIVIKNNTIGIQIRSFTLQPLK